MAVFLTKVDETCDIIELCSGRIHMVHCELFARFFFKLAMISSGTFSQPFPEYFLTVISHGSKFTLQGLSVMIISTSTDSEGSNCQDDLLPDFLAVSLSNRGGSRCMPNPEWNRDRSLPNGKPDNCPSTTRRRRITEMN